MALGLVFIEYFLDLPVQSPVDGGQALAQVFMYSRFTDAEPAGGGADSGLVLNNVQRQFFGPFLDVSFHTYTTPMLLAA